MRDREWRVKGQGQEEEREGKGKGGKEGMEGEREGMFSILPAHF